MKRIVFGLVVSSLLSAPLLAVLAPSGAEPVQEVPAASPKVPPTAQEVPAEPTAEPAAKPRVASTEPSSGSETASTEPASGSETGAAEGQTVEAPTEEGEKEEGEEDEKEKLSEKTLRGLEWRSIGPALMSGRIADVAIDPGSPNTWYVAVGSGNLWKTTNAGTTWSAIFDDQPSYSMGCVTIDPNDAHVIRLGTGEAVGGRHVGFGDGVYVSRDAGKSWTKKGLGESEHVAKILVDPRDSDVVFVAAQGPLWSKGGERGLYRSTDGGATWTNVLSAGPYTGVTDVVMDPRDPDVLYAATHQRQRTVAALVNGGPESGIHKSVDGGTTWRELKRGLPGEDKGKIALAVSPQRPDVVYATIELAGRTGGFWRSEDGGESWEKRSDYVGGGTGAHYYQELWPDPHRFDVLYQANVNLGRTEDGGTTWQSVGNGNKHVDNHAVAFHPTDPDFLLVGCDGGLYVSRDRGKTYDFTANLPLTQFYKVDVDYDWPVYHVVGGTQDNNTQYGPAWTMTRQGIRNADWRITIGGDGHDCAIDPTNPDVVYCESQEGYLRRFDRRTGQSLDIRPRPEAGEEEYRFNWDSPIHISPHDPARIYYAANRLFRSDDRGDSWTPISGDLTRGSQRLTMPLMDRVWSVDAMWDLFAMSVFGSITSISESPLVAGLIYVGTDDGLLQVTEDGGGTWRRIEEIEGIPAFAFVNDVKADRHDPDTVYAVFDNHKEGDYRPFVVKSTDRGRTWTSLAAGLPERHVCWRIVQDHEEAALLFLGTEFGVFVTLDGGTKWFALKNGMPTIPVRDLEIQRREDDLVAATFGRGFYVLDDYAPLRGLTEERLAENELVLFPVRKALLYVPDDVLGGSRGSLGDSYFTAENRPFGAVFTYWLRDALETREAMRKKEEKKLAKKGEDTPFPGWDALKQQEREAKPTIVLEIREGGVGEATGAGEDAAAGLGPVVDRIEGKTSAGLHRVEWELRYAPFTVGPSGGRRGPRGPLVPPGTYTVVAYKRIGDVTTTLGEPRSFSVESIVDPTLPPQTVEAILAFQREAGELRRAVQGTGRVLEDALEQVREIQTLARGGRKVELRVWDEARDLELRLLDVRESLFGSDTKTKRGEMDVPSVSSRASTALRGSMGQTHGPTATHRRQYEIAREDYVALVDELRQLVDVDLAALHAKLDASGAPWTRGRGIPSLGRGDGS